MALALLGADAAGIRVERDPAGCGATVDVDPVQIQQVLVNLLRNAVDSLLANPPGAERRLIVATRALPDQGAVIFRIADTGPGIAPGIRGRLFTPFVTSKPNGMGLGLSVCRRIVEAHGGTIEVVSQNGPGAAFTVRLARAIRA